MCALIESFPAESDQIWKSWISSISSIFRTSSKHDTTSMVLGVASISTLMQSFKIGPVVKTQSTVKIIVQIGSAILA